MKLKLLVLYCVTAIFASSACFLGTKLDLKTNEEQQINRTADNKDPELTYPHSGFA